MFWFRSAHLSNSLNMDHFLFLFFNTSVDDTPDLEGTGYLSNTLLMTLNSDFPMIRKPADELESLQYDGLEHLTGYICHRIKNPDLSIQDIQQGSSFTWTNQLTEGFLQKPTAEMMDNMERMEEIFKNFNKNEIVYCRSYLKQLLNLSKDIHTF